MKAGIVDNIQRIVTSGLVLNLDAANPLSYPGSGSTWTDLSGNGNNGTIVGATFNSANGGIFVFNNPTSAGSSEYVNMGANFVGQPTAFTVNHFIYLEASQSQRTIFSNYEFPSNSGWVTGISDSTNNVLKFYLGSATLFSSTTLSNQVWYNVAITYDSGNPKIYINGVLDASSSNTINYVAGNTLNNEIGRLSGLAFQYFYGSIGIAMYYNRALSATEITQNFNAQKSRFGL
jgi:hypothetical protein